MQLENIKQSCLADWGHVEKWGKDCFPIAVDFWF